MNTYESPHSDTMIIDLRSDTVTRPTPGMREAMARAEVGDMQYGDDPTLNALEQRVATLLGKEAALWLPSGTMANQVALRVLTRPGDDVLVGSEAHSVWHEAGGSAANSGVQFTVIGTNGMFTADQLRAHSKPRNSPVLPIPGSTLVQVENTHNRHGGRYWSLADLQAIGQTAKELGLASFMDGARIWNAAVASGHSVQALSAPFDMVAVAFSKALGAPAGSILAGSSGQISEAIRHRRMLGGAMRQVGMLAAACDYGLSHHLERIVSDHQNARLIAGTLRRCPAVVLATDEPPTNIVVFELDKSWGTAEALVKAAREKGVLINALGPAKLRLLTHLDVSRSDCEQAASILVDLLNSKAT